jgi:hypothetical protein
VEPARLSARDRQAGVKLGRVVINRPVVFEYSELASVRVLGAGER